MTETGKVYSYYREKHTLFEGDVVVYKRPKSTADKMRERATQERWQMQLKIPGQHRITKSTKTGNLGDALLYAYGQGAPQDDEIAAKWSCREDKQNGET